MDSLKIRCIKRMPHGAATIIITVFCLTACHWQKEKCYHFDGTGISEKVLENYLERSVTMSPFLVRTEANPIRNHPFYEDDIRLIKNIGPKFIGRAIYRWGGEGLLADPAFWDQSKSLIEHLHGFDPDIVFQACLFECITEDVIHVKIPSWVFADYGLPVEDRTFSYQAMLHDDGLYVDHWREGSSVPDVTKIETRLWFYFLAGSYMNIGCEALHLGQVELIGKNDPEKSEWSGLLTKIRAYASKHARRSWVLLDAHVPKHGMIKDGISLIDFNSFPMRIKEIPDKPMECKLQVNYLDGLYQKSKACIAASGWSCEHLPFLVEFDNYGINNNMLNRADTTSHYVWGYDEISWFSIQTKAYRNQWLEYAYNWLKKTDPKGHLQMPVTRIITVPNQPNRRYHANTRSEHCPTGYSQEETIKRLWAE